MTEGSPAPKRGLLGGYRTSAVDKMLSDQDLLLREAEGRVQAAEARVARLEAELAAISEAKAPESEQTGPAGDAGPASTETTARFLNEELATILVAAEQSATKIVERARASTQQQVAEAQRVWRQAQEQATRLTTWRDRLESVLHRAESKIGEVRSRIEEVPEQIRQALLPLADAVAALDGDLAAVSRTGNPPPVLLKPERAEAEGEPDVPAGIEVEVLEIAIVQDEAPAGKPQEGEASGDGAVTAPEAADEGVPDSGAAPEANQPEPAVAES